MGLQISSADGLRSVLPKYNIVWWLMEIRLVGSDQRDVFAKEIPFSPTSHPGSIRYVSTNHQSGADQELEAVVIYRSCPTIHSISLYMTHYSSKRLKGMHEVCTKSLRITVVTQANKSSPKNQLYSLVHEQPTQRGGGLKSGYVFERWQMHGSIWGYL